MIPGDPMKVLLRLAFFIFYSQFAVASLEPNYSEVEAIEQLKFIHAQFSLLHGTFNEEFPEQVMSMMFISPNDKVIEIGGNIGRNSCVISALLNDSSNLVVLESDPGIASGLIANRDRNGLGFHVEASAISQVPLIQAGWVTVPSQHVPLGHLSVNTLTYAELKEKYGVDFNVLVADCEGALYYLLKDDESLLKDVSLIIVENDYHHRIHYESVCSKFIAHGFELVYQKAFGSGPCGNEFYQVWKKLNSHL